MWSHWCQIKVILLYIMHTVVTICLSAWNSNQVFVNQILYRGFNQNLSSLQFCLNRQKFYVKNDIHLYYVSCCLNWTNIYVVEVCTCIFSYVTPHFVKWGQPTKHQFHRKNKKQILKKLPSLLQISICAVTIKYTCSIHGSSGSTA